jgi:hypothetical protein
MPESPITVQNLPDWLLRQNLPQWIRQQNQGASDVQLTGAYRNYLYGNSNAPGASRLTSLYSNYLASNPKAPGNTGLHTFRPYTPPGSTPPPGAPPGGPGSPPSPALPPPVTTSPTGAPQPPGQKPPGLRDIYDVYLSTVPIMEQERDKQISSAMATAGFSGNRYGSSAIRTAGQIGAETALKQNQLLNTLMHDQNEADANRSLQSAGLGLQQAQLDDQMQRSRLDQLFNFGRWEQGRTDDYARLGYEDFERNKYGLLPLLIQFAGSQSGGSPGTPYTVQQPGGTGAADWLTLLAGLIH